MVLCELRRILYFDKIVLSLQPAESEINYYNLNINKMFSYSQDPDVVRWGLQLFDGGPPADNSYSSYGPQSYTDCYQDPYSREVNYDTECVRTENEKHQIVEPSCEAVDHSQASFYLQDSLQQPMANYTLGKLVTDNKVRFCLNV